MFDDSDSPGLNNLDPRNSELRRNGTILDAAATGSDSTVFPTPPRREKDAPSPPLLQISPSSETKELLANLMNLLQHQSDRLERVENGRNRTSGKIYERNARGVPSIHGNRHGSLSALHDSPNLKREGSLPRYLPLW